MHRAHTSRVKQLRSFGLIVGGIFVLIGVWPLLWHAQSLRLWSLLLGGVLVLLALFWPGSLTQVYRLWMALGEILGRVNSTILLSVLFYGMFTPMGLVMRLLGKDPMRRTITSEVDSYRVLRQARPASHMTHQF